jgi:hypothetical protein
MWTHLMWPSESRVKLRVHKGNKLLS